MNTTFRILPLAGLLLLFLAVPAARAVPADNPLDLPPDVDAQLLAALDANYRLDFDRARTILATLQPQADAHPMIMFGEVLTEWWRLASAVLEEDEAESARLLALADTCIARAEAHIAATGDPTGEGHLVKGATLGLLGRWHIKNRHWMKSYFIGKRAKADLLEALAINPRLHDAYSGIGIYDYFVAKLPGIVRLLAFTGQGGDPADGLREVDHALAHGRYTVVGTQAALALIHIRNELDPARALEIIDTVLADYPASPFFRSLRTIALYDLDRPADLAAEADLQARLLTAGEFPASRAAQVHFTRGLAHFRAHEWTEARAAYTEAVRRQHPSDPFGTWARLHLANILDIEDQRRDAVRAYREVERLTNRWGTARLADRYLDTPFDPAKNMVRLLPD